MNQATIDFAYLATAVCFILSLKLMNSPLTARKGNWTAMIGMAIALVSPLAGWLRCRQRSHLSTGASRTVRHRYPWFSSGGGSGSGW